MNNMYKYLGIERANRINDKEAKKKIRKKTLKTVKSIIKEEYSSYNLIRRIYSDAISIMRYSFQAVRWNMNELEEIDKKIRKYLVECYLYSNNLCKARLYLPSSELGYDLVSLRDEYGKELTRTICQLLEYNRNDIINMQKWLGKRKNTAALMRQIEKAFFKRVDMIELTKMIENEEKSQNEIIRYINKELIEYYCKKWNKATTSYKIKEGLDSKLIN